MPWLQALQQKSNVQARECYCEGNVLRAAGQAARASETDGSLWSPFASGKKALRLQSLPNTITAWEEFSLSSCLADL